jgi:hypothetical protein
MPVLKPNNIIAPHYYPVSNYEIARYWTLEKFLNLIQKQKLFFCRLDYLEDRFEGTVPKLNRQKRIDHNKYLRENFPDQFSMTDLQIEQNVEEIYTLEKKFKSLTLVNCWNRFEGESAALWKIYSGLNNGILTISSVAKIQYALDKIDEELYLSEVGYLDYETEDMPDGNLLFPVIHKQKAFNYENEVRLIQQIIPETGWEHNWSSEEITAGRYIDVEVNELINRIIISPNAEKWFFELVKDLIEKYGLKKEVRYSTLKF